MASMSIIIDAIMHLFGEEPDADTFYKNNGRLLIMYVKIEYRKNN